MLNKCKDNKTNNSMNMKPTLNYDKLKKAFENELELSLVELTRAQNKISSDFVRYFDVYTKDILTLNKYIKLLKGFLNVLTKDHYDEIFEFEYKKNLKRLVYRSSVAYSTNLLANFKADCERQAIGRYIEFLEML